MPTAKFEIHFDQVGASKLEVNDIDFMHEFRVTAAQVTAYADRPTLLALTIAAPTGVVTGEGIVEIYHEPPDFGKLIDRMDPKRVEDEALKRMGWGDNRAIVEIVLDIVKEKIVEAQPQAGREDDQQPDGG